MTIRVSAFQQIRELARGLNGIPARLWDADPVQCAVHMTANVFGKESIDLASAVEANASESLQSIGRSTCLNLLVAGLWARCGKPVVTLGHRTAAALASTTISQEAAQMIRPPWPAFLVRLPTPLLTIDDAEKGIPLPAPLLMIAALPSSTVDPSDHDRDPNELRWWWKLTTDIPAYMQPFAQALNSDAQTVLQMGLGGVSLWGFNVEPNALIAEAGSHTHWDDVRCTDRDERVTALTKRLVLNACLYCDAPNNPTRYVQEGIRLSSRTSKQDELGTYTNHDLQTGIALNLCEPMREYIATGRTPPKYALWVAPHWKRVVHGPGRTLRKLQYIQSYKRGGEARP